MKVWMALLVSLSLATSCAAAKQDVTFKATPVTPTNEQAKLDQTIARLLAQYHYRQAKMDDKMSARVLDNYIKALDFNRSYFLASDINGFNKYRTVLDDYLMSGNLQPAYDIFNLYERRVAERTERILEQLNQPVNFNIDESVDLDRKKAPWAASESELNELWRKRLKHELLTLMLAGKDQNAARKTLQERYQGFWRRTSQSNPGDVFQTYMNAVSQTFDPHTAYFSPRAMENFNIQMSLSLEGVGSVLRMEEERVTVVELVAGGPADLSKEIRPNDKIVGVGQGDREPIVDIIGWRLDDVVDLIRGPRGSVVRLQIVPAKAGADGVMKTVRLVRDTIKLEKQAAKGEIKNLSADGHGYRIGIITIPAFYSDFAAAQRGDKDYRSTTRDVRRLLEDLRGKVDGVVLDLRQNGGGSLQEAVELTGLFIKEGPVVQVRSTNGRVEIEEDPDAAMVYDGPLAVLVDRFSASASEIFAAAIQDYGRGLVVGDTTFGKGTVQTLIDLNRFMPRSQNPLGELKLTVAKFYRVNGSSTQHRGVTPDITLPAAFDNSEVGESTQDNALPWDKIGALSYQNSRYLAGLVPELTRRYQARTASDSAFKELLVNFDEARQDRKNTVVSLLRGKRQAEWDKTQDKLLTRENQIRRTEGLEPLKKGQEIPERDQDKEPDLMRDQSARILADMISLIDQQGGRRMMLTGN